MSKTVFDLEGRVSLTDKNFIAKIKRLHGALKGLNKDMKLKSAGTMKPTREYAALTKQIKDAEAAIASLNRQRERQAKQHTTSQEYKTMQKEIAATEAELDRLIEQQIAIADLPHGALFNDLEEQINRGHAKLEEMKAALASMAENGATDEQARKWGETADKIDQAEKELEQYKAQAASMRATGAAFEKPLGGKKGPSFFQKFKQGAKHLKAMIPLQGMVAKGFGRISRQANKMKRGLMMGAGIRGLVRLGIAGAVALYSIRMLKEGLANLRQYDAATNNSLNMMTNSLNTLRNALATAFAPILNVVAPIITTFIDYLVAAVTAIAHFMAALTGQSQVTIARKSFGGVSSAAGGAADSTNAANDAANEYKKTLMGFDQINKLDDPTSGSGGGGGGGGGAGGSGSMFDTVPIDSTMANWADKIKEAWANADFYDIGRELGEKLKAGLESIPWDEIQAVGAKIGKSVATGLNGFFETPELGKVIGDTIAEALNTIVITVNSFTVNFHWESLGNFVSESINGFFSTFDWKLTGQTISGIAKGILDSAIAAVEGVNWNQVGSSIMTMLTSIDYAGIAQRMMKLLGDAIVGALGLIDGALETLKNKLVEKIRSGEIWGDIGATLNVSLEAVLHIIDKAWDSARKMFSFSAEITATLILSGIAKIIGWLYEKTTGNDSADLQVKIMGASDSFTQFLQKLMEFIAAPLPMKISIVTGTIGAGIQWIIDKLSGNGGGSADLGEVSAKLSLKDTAVNLTATITGWVKGSSFGNTIGGMIANFTDKVKSFSVDTVGGWVANFTKKAKDFSVDTVGGWIAKFTKKIVDVGAETVSGFKAKITKTVVKLTKKQKNLGGGFIATVTSIVNKVKKKLGGIFHKEGGTFSSGRWRPVTAFEGGGYPSGSQVFVAREAGPELVGTIGGNTAVMNNDQIVASVADGVAKAMVNVMQHWNSGSGNTNVTIEGDMAQFFRVVQQKAVDYTRTTGQPAFPV